MSASAVAVAGRVCVIGQGYVGLHLATSAAVAGFHVVGIDLDDARVRALGSGRNVVAGMPDTLFALGMDTGRLTFSRDASAAADADVVVICVPTPVVEHRPDLRFIERAAHDVAPHLRPGALVILESTTYPGTTENVLVPILAAHGHCPGDDVLVAYSPERIDPGNGKYGFRNTPRVVGGLTARSTEAAVAFYRRMVDDVHALSGCRAAELAKLLENTFRMVNIALVNELARLCADQDIDVWEVVDAAATKPFGFMPFYPGPGVGGHCIPLDPTYLAWQARRDTGRPCRLVELAQDINAEMPSYVAARIAEALNDRSLAVRGSRVLALGVTYKPDVGDIRESAALEVLRILARRGALISFHDPFVPSIELDQGALQRSTCTPESLAAVDCVALLTPHQSYDLEQIAAHAALVFDARNAIADRRPGSVVRL